MNHQGTLVTAAPVFSHSRFLTASCAAAATAAYLGASWLRTPIFGLPTGLWMIGIAQGAALAWQHRAARLVSSDSSKPLLKNLATVDLGRIAGALAAAAIDAAHHFALAAHISPDRLRELDDSLSQRFDALPRATPALRIGIDADPALAASFSASSPATHWLPVSGPGPQRLLRRHALDALIIHRPGEPLKILTPEHPGKEAAWYDWSSPRPLTYASLFPIRLDAAQVTIDDPDLADASELRLIATLARAAAALSRAPARLTFSDRLRGRPALATHSTDSPSPADACLREVAEALTAHAPIAPTSARRAAARIASAWVSSAERWLDLPLRRATIEAAVTLLPDEPELLLRTAAVRFAACDDRPALDALVAAQRAILATTPHSAADHLPFLQAEVELGLPGPMTLGRVAAALCLVCATSPAPRLPYIKGDFMDDARYSAWLVGRDQDRALLVEIFRALEEGRPGLKLRHAA